MKQMKRISLGCIVIIFFLTTSSAPDAKLVSVSDKIDPNIEARLPATVRFQQLYAQKSGKYPWNMRPGLYGFTEAPPAAVQARLFNDGRLTAGLILGWASYVLDYAGRPRIPELLEIVRHSVGRVHVSIVAPTNIRSGIENALRSAGIEPGKVEFISFPREFPDDRQDRTLDTVWIRDYGPLFVYSQRDTGFKMNIIDMSYLPFPWPSRSKPVGRVRDDALPTRLGDTWGFQVFRPRLIVEGGNLLTDGQGACFISNRMMDVNRTIFGGSYKLHDILQKYCGCRRTIVLQELAGETTGHIDMFMTVVTPKTILIGSYDPYYDAANAAILNKNSQTLKEAGYNVIRIPMPRPYSVEGIRVWATFANALRVNTAMLVPVYRNPKFPADLRRNILIQEAEAIRKFRNALPGVEVIPVVSDALIPFGGSLHCIAMTYFETPQS